jgi:hypothetical protein
VNTILQLTNEVSIGDDGWAQLAPFGDFPGVAFTADGPKPAIQRVDAEAGDALRRSLRSFTGRAARFFRSVPIYNGHPDVPQISDRYEDREPKGHVADLEVRADGIYIRPVFSNSGAALLNGARRLGFSAYVDADVIPSDDGKIHARWTTLRSAGLTDRPNLPVQLLNEKPDHMPPKLIAALVVAGITLANEANETQVLEGIATLQRQRDDAVALANTRATEVATTVTARDQARTELANERAAHITEVLSHAVESGRISEADRAVWKGRLEHSFANESAALSKLTPTWKVSTTTANDGRRTGADATASGRTAVELCNEAVAKVMKDNPTLGFRDAYIRAVESNPGLFA